VRVLYSLRSQQTISSHEHVVQSVTPKLDRINGAVHGTASVNQIHRRLRKAFPWSISASYNITSVFDARWWCKCVEGNPPMSSGTKFDPARSDPKYRYLHEYRTNEYANCSTYRPQNPSYANVSHQNHPAKRRSIRSSGYRCKP
jgi:hypothetical protein